VDLVAAPFTHLADELGGAKATNMVMLGALLERAHVPFEQEVIEVLRRLVHSQRWLEIDLAALARGRRAIRENAEVGNASICTR
jgi:Pyruvate/2-oxoacid:ferredoxin oxidoreductase gamma subunit